MCVRAAPDVRQALRDNDPAAQRPGSPTEVPLKRPPLASGRGIPKGFYSGPPPPLIGSIPPLTPPPRPVPSTTCPPSTPTTGPPAQHVPDAHPDGPTVGQPMPKDPPQQIQQTLEPASKQPRLKTYPKEAAPQPSASSQAAQPDPAPADAAPLCAAAAAMHLQPNCRPPAQATSSTPLSNLPFLPRQGADPWAQTWYAKHQQRSHETRSRS